MRRSKLIISLVWIILSRSLFAQQPKLILLTGHTDGINSSQYSADGKKIVTASLDNTAKIWDSESGKLIRNLVGHTSAIRSACFSPDGTMVVTASWDKTSKIWDVETGDVLADLIGHTSWITSACFSPDNKRIVTTSYDNLAKLWDVETGKLIADLMGHTSFVVSAQFSPDDSTIVTASGDYTAKIWNAKTGKLVADLKGHNESLNSAMYSPDGQFIVTASNDTSALVWNAQTGKLKLNLTGHSASIHSAHFSPNSQKIVTASGDSLCLIWDVETGKIISSLGEQNSGVESAHFSPDGSKIVTTHEDHSFKIWDVEKGKLYANLMGQSFMVSSFNFSPDGHKIVLASEDKTAKLWDLETGKQVLELKGNTAIAISTAFSKDGKKITTVWSDHSIKTWDVGTGRLLSYSKGNPFIDKLVRDSPDGKKIVTISMEETAKIWDTESGDLVAELLGHSNWVYFANFSADGKKVITASSDSTCKIWDTETGTVLADIRGYSSEVNSANFSMDGKRIVMTFFDRTAKVWDAETGLFLTELKGHTSTIESACFSMDGKWIVTSSSDYTAKVWEAATGRIKADLRGHSDKVNTANFNADGKRVVTGSNDGTTKVWDAEKGELIYSFIALDSNDYLVIDKDLRYDGTEVARKLVYFRCGMEVIELNQIKDLLWEPGLVGEINGVNPSAITARKLSEMGICNQAPVVEEESYKEGSYHYKITPNLGGLGAVQFYVNDKMIKTYDTTQLKFKAPSYYLSVLQKEIDPYFISGRRNKVKVIATTLDGMILSKGLVSIHREEKRITTKPNIFIVSIGISDYKGDKLKLKFASKDAIDFSYTLKPAAQKLFNTDGKDHVYEIVLHTQLGTKLRPDKFSIQRIMYSISQTAKSDDVLIVFFAGYGALAGGERKNVYLLTADAKSFDLRGLEKESAISTDELGEWMRKIKAHNQLLIIDACMSDANSKEQFVGKDIPADQVRAMEDLFDKTNSGILSGSATNQSAYDTNLYDHGLLVESLLSGIKLGHGLKGNRYIEVNKWMTKAFEHAQILSPGIGGRQEPFIRVKKGFQIGIADEEVRNGIRVIIHKKLFNGSIISTTENPGDDNLGLSNLIDKELVELQKEGNPSFLFVPGNSYNESYSIHGKYALSESIITITINVIKGDDSDSNFTFEMSGDMKNREELAKKIVEKVLEHVNK